MEPCPFCAEPILDEARKCKHCQSILGETDRQAGRRRKDDV
jgi:hypothetical protein